ncbi:MAG: alpha/beta hydrolase [Leptospira sp.]|nr:alpha/beta hydrolase [Leptospira sp.]
MKNAFILLYFVSLMSFFINCEKPSVGNLINERIQNPFDTTQSLDIYFATTRDRHPMAMKSCSNSFYTSNKGEGLRFGSCQVNVPAHHAIGSLDFANLGSKDKFFTFLDSKEFEEHDFIKQVSKSSQNEIILFVHGFNVGFEESILRASQIKYDMKFQGDIIVFTWPAGSKDESLLGQFFIKDTYQSNYKDALASRINFNEFINALEKTKKKVHIIVHSMGHQIALPTLSGIGKNKSSKIIGELILNAPDYDSKEFYEIVPNLIQVSERVTLYCSPGDNALLASQKVNGGRRAGMCSRYSGIDVINVNEVDDPVMGIGGLGHGYYSSRPILTDIYQVLLGVSVEKRLFIRKSGSGNSEAYILRK